MVGLLFLCFFIFLFNQLGFVKDLKGGIRGVGYYIEVVDLILVVSGNENVDVVIYYFFMNIINNIFFQ